MAYIDLIRGDSWAIRKLRPDEFIPRKDLRGLKIGRLTVLEFHHKGGPKGRTYYYTCKCDCGKTSIKSSSYLLRNDKYAPHKSCGCWHRELKVAASTTHGRTAQNGVYKIWMEIKTRCKNQRSKAYRYYGGRGIKVCDRWLGEHGFENFLADMGERPGKEYSIDRIDVNGDYCPENCRWATRIEQCNNRRSNILITYKNRTQTLRQWCEELSLNYSNARNMISVTGRSLEYVVNHQLKNKKNG